MILVFKTIFLFIAIFFTFNLIIKMAVNARIVPGDVLWAAVGITGFVVLHWLI